jgi:hypothetical protein
MYKRAAASICLPVLAEGPVMGKIRPILKACWAWACGAPSEMTNPKQAASKRVFMKQLRRTGEVSLTELSEENRNQF